jgi:predicted peptidase
MKKMKSQILLFVSLILFTFASSAARRQVVASPEGITISGVSSGAYLAVQMHVAFSELFSGSASVAGGTYWCAEGNVITAQMDCMKFPKTQSADASLAKLKNYESEGLVDPTSNLRNDRVFLFSSQKDSIVNSKNSIRLENFYKSLIPSQQITHVKSQEAGHGFLTQNFGRPCGEEALPWLQNCNQDLAGQILQSMYGQLRTKSEAIEQNLKSFSQKEFDTKGEALLALRGWVYVPTVCKQGKQCRLHMALHGCEQNVDFVNDTFVKNAGYNEWAESNGIIVLYPQTSKSLTNPKACWDWFGLTGSRYATKAGPQMRALYNMVRMFVPGLPQN